MSAQHTPTPWEPMGAFAIGTTEGKYVATVTAMFGLAHANALRDQIITACNAHDELVEACHTARQYLPAQHPAQLFIAAALAKAGSA